MQATRSTLGRRAPDRSFDEPAHQSAPLAPLTGEQRKALVAEINAESWQRVCGQVRHRPRPGRLRSWDLTPEGRVLAGVQTRQALVWLDAGPIPILEPSDQRLRHLLADRKAREPLWRLARRPSTHDYADQRYKHAKPDQSTATSRNSLNQEPSCPSP